MVSRQIVLETVKRMYSSGVDDETIRATLKDIGLSPAEVESYLREVKGEKQEPALPKQEPAKKKKVEEESLFAEDESSDEGQDLGLDDDDLSDDSDSDLFEEEASSSDALAEKTASKIKEHLDDHLASRDVQNESALSAIEEQREHASQMHKKIDALNEKISSVSTMPPETLTQIGLIEKKLLSIEKDLAEIKASENALQSLLKKILETNKEILNKKK